MAFVRRDMKEDFIIRSDLPNFFSENIFHEGSVQSHLEFETIPPRIPTIIQRNASEISRNPRDFLFTDSSTTLHDEESRGNSDCTSYQTGKFSTLMDRAKSVRCEASQILKVSSSLPPPSSSLISSSLLPSSTSPSPPPPQRWLDFISAALIGWLFIKSGTKKGFTTLILTCAFVRSTLM